MKSLYTVQLAAKHESAFASALILARFTFSYSEVAGFKVAVNKEDSICVHEMSAICHRFGASATDGNIPEMLPSDAYKAFAEQGARSMRDIWNRTPKGQAIKNIAYLAIADYLSTQARISVVDFAAFWNRSGHGDFWGMTPVDAMTKVQRWFNAMKRDEITLERWFAARDNAANRGVQHPPEIV